MLSVKHINFLTSFGDVMNALTSDSEEIEPAVEALLEHVSRYRLSTFAVMSQLPQFVGRSPRYLRRVLRYCRDAQLMSSAILHSGSRYWFLEAVGAERCGLDTGRSGPLSENAKIRAYAMLLFCFCSDRTRHLLTGSELCGTLAVLHRQGMPATYYLDPSGDGNIGLARIDAGRHGRWDRIVNTIKSDITQHLGLPGFRDFIDADRFEISVLTAFPAKAARLVDAFGTTLKTGHVPVRVITNAMLVPLLYSIKQKT